MESWAKDWAKAVNKRQLDKHLRTAKKKQKQCLEPEVSATPTFDGDLLNVCESCYGRVDPRSRCRRCGRIGETLAEIEILMGKSSTTEALSKDEARTIVEAFMLDGEDLDELDEHNPDFGRAVRKLLSIAEVPSRFVDDDDASST